MTITNPATGRELARRLPRTAPVTARRPVPSALGVLLVAAGLAVGVVAGLGWFTAQLPGWWTTVGPDYVHTARDDAEAAACNTLAVTYDQYRCVLYLAEDDVTEAKRTPRAEGTGGVCPLSTRYDCARWAGLPPRDGDVPLWRPWELHNGPAAMTLNAVGSAGIGVLLAATVTVLDRPGGARRSWPRRLAALLGRVLAGAGVGALAGIGLLTLTRHPLTALPVAALPQWLAPAAAVAALLAVVAGTARAARSRRDGGPR